MMRSAELGTKRRPRKALCAAPRQVALHRHMRSDWDQYKFLAKNRVDTAQGMPSFSSLFFDTCRGVC